MKHVTLMYQEAERMKPFNDEIQIIEQRHLKFLKKHDSIYRKFGNRIRDHFVAIEGYFRWHVWTDLTEDIKQEVEDCYKKHVK